jgi:hypothetical protein
MRETNPDKVIPRRVSVSLLDCLLWGFEMEGVSPKSSPSPPKSPTVAVLESPIRRSLHFWGGNSDAYGWRAHLALDAICGIHSPEGLIVWLREHSPLLYRRLTQDLPNQISRAWDARIPHKDFDALCFELVDTYRRAAELYRG